MTTRFDIKETGEYWESDITDNLIIDADSRDFIYENAINYAEAINKSMQGISGRSLILLSYLILVISFCITHIITHFAKNGFILDWEIIALSTFVLYYGWISLDIVYSMKPRKVHSSYQEPKVMLQNNVIKLGYHEMKLTRCVELQESIYINRYLMNKMYMKFENAIARTFVIPAIWRVIKKFICHCA